MPQKPPRWPVSAAMVAPQYQSLWRGLVGHWIMWEGAGLRAFDISDRGNHGTLINGPTWVASEHGLALNFDGVDQYGEIPANAIIGNANNITISAWARDDSTATPDGLIYERSDGFKVGTMTIYTATATREARVFVNTTGGFFQVDETTGTDMDDGKYHHVVGRYDEDALELSLFFDGVLVDTIATTGTLTSLPNDKTFIGGRSATLGWTGHIVEVRIYGRALTPAEIRSLYQDPFGAVRPVLRVAGRTPTPPISTFDDFVPVTDNTQRIFFWPHRGLYTLFPYPTGSGFDDEGKRQMLGLYPHLAIAAGPRPGSLLTLGVGR